MQEGLYERRFGLAERRAKTEVWAVLCRHFFQDYVGPNDAVLDLGAGLCEFINHIECRQKWAVDMDENIGQRAAAGVTTHCGPAHDLSWLGNGAVDVVFASNLFEHFASKDLVLQALREVHRVLGSQGRLLILQPNIRYAYKVYWDFFDHHLPFSHESMLEALHLGGFEATEVRPRFLPYTTKSRLPSWPMLARLYLRCPPLHRVLGKQMFIAARKV